jgi:hypothetical protein
MKNFKIALLTLYPVVVLFASFTFAQNKPAAGAAPAPPAIIGVTMMQIKPGMGFEWESYLKRDLIPALKKGGIKQLGIAKTKGFGISDNYVITIPMASITELDAPDPIAKALGADGLVILLSNMQRCVANARSYMLIDRPDLGIAAKPDYVFKMGVFVTLSVTPGRAEEFEKNTKALVAVMAKTNAKAVLTGKVAMGGNPNEYNMFVAFDDFADLEKFVPAITKAAAEAKLAPETGILAWEEMATYSMAPELSIQ